MASLPATSFTLLTLLVVGCLGAPHRKSIWSPTAASTEVTLGDDADDSEVAWDEDDAFELDGDSWLSLSPEISQSKWYDHDELSRPPDADESEEDSLVDSDEDDEDDNDDEYLGREDERDGSKKKSEGPTIVTDDTPKVRHAGHTTHQDENDIDEDDDTLSRLDDDDQRQDEKADSNYEDDALSYPELGEDNFADDDEDDLFDDEEDDDDMFSVKDEDEPQKIFDDGVLLF